MTAENARTTAQTTTWNYGTTLVNSDIASSQLLRSIAYPDSVSSGDVVAYTYNRQGERTSLTDQRGCVHEFEYDALGRQIHDRVTTPGTGVDTTVLRLSTTYEVRGMVTTLTSWDNASVTEGNAVNQCLFVYNNFSQLIADYQEHGGEVDTETTPVVQYTYADGADNTIRPTALIYPNGRVLYYAYGSTDGINDAASRICSLIDNDEILHLADYAFIGLNQFVIVDYTEPHVKYTLADLSEANDPDTGDIYSGWDRFTRVKDCQWHNYATNTDVVRLKYGYDRASDRLWRADFVAQSLGKNFDELYSYDGLHRLKDMQRGLLNESNTAITDETFAQCWSLDSTSNWHGFRESADGGSWTTVQSRTANAVNEITDITNSVGEPWATPEYDAAGNMTTIPTQRDPVLGWETLSLDDWDALTEDQWGSMALSPSNSSCMTATYDAWNRMVTVTDPGNDETIQVNSYDPRNFRVARSAAGGSSRDFYYTTSWQAIEERLNEDLERQRTWGQRYVDDLVLRDRDTTGNGTLDERLNALQDSTWNVVSMSNNSGSTRIRCVYSSYGAPTLLDSEFVEAEVSMDVDTLYSGYTYDSNTALSIVRRRYYSNIGGVWLRRDPLGSLAGTNSYAYCAASPYNWVDPSGLAHTYSPLSHAYLKTCIVTMGSYYSPEHHPQFWNDHIRWNDTAYRLARSLRSDTTVLVQAQHAEAVVGEVSSQKCCQVILMGHRGGPDFPGGIGTADPEGTGRVELFPSTSFNVAIKAAIAANNCNSGCRLYIYSCGTDHPEGIENQRKLAADTGCTVCGTRKLIALGAGQSDFEPRTAIPEPGIDCISPADAERRALEIDLDGWGALGSW